MGAVAVAVECGCFGGVEVDIMDAINRISGWGLVRDDEIVKAQGGSMEKERGKRRDQLTRSIQCPPPSRLPLGLPSLSGPEELDRWQAMSLLP